MKNHLNTTGETQKSEIKYTLDGYTKLILSIIAFCLILMTVNIYLKPVNLNAQQQIQDVNLKSINGNSIYGSELPVNLQRINGRSINDNIPVNIQQLKGWDLWDSQLPVDIKSVNGNMIYGSEVPIKVR
ncbi:MAG: hypothetical protein ABSF32_04700 [Ignavibacteria bacterium]|jgi:hypothetical protein